MNDSQGKFILVSCLISFAVSMMPKCGLKRCMMRYEFAKELHLLWRYKNCTDVYNWACSCRKSIDVLYMEIPPYIYTDPTSKEVVGLLPGILNESLKTCCYGCTKVNYLKPCKTTNEAILRLRTATILMPLMMQAGSKEFVGNQYLEFFDTKGVAYVTIKEMNLAHFAKFVSSILSTWPLFLISILMAVDAGILVWLLDCWSNKEAFPLEFRSGVIEGLWWAYVTMTTVGYGDKTPKSLPARIFAIIWITVGISLSSIFTASFITGMTQSLDEGELNLHGKTVGITNMSTRYEYQIGMRDNADMRIYPSYQELKSALKNKSVEGIMMDVMILSHFYEDLKKDIDDLHIRVNAIKNSKTSIGLTFPQNATNATNREWANFLSKFYVDNHDNMDILLNVAMNGLNPKLTDVFAIAAAETSDQLSIFNSEKIYKMLLKQVGLATLVLFCFGFCFEKIKLVIKMYIASRQYKWKNKVEARKAKASVLQRRVTVSSQAQSTEDKIREKFQSAMKEIEIEEGCTNHLTNKILKKVFPYTVIEELKETDLDE